MFLQDVIYPPPLCQGVYARRGGGVAARWSRGVAARWGRCIPACSGSVRTRTACLQQCKKLTNLYKGTALYHTLEILCWLGGIPFGDGDLGWSFCWWTHAGACHWPCLGPLVSSRPTSWWTLDSVHFCHWPYLGLHYCSVENEPLSSPEGPHAPEGPCPLEGPRAPVGPWPPASTPSINSIHDCTMSSIHDCTMCWSQLNGDLFGLCSAHLLSAANPSICLHPFTMVTSRLSYSDSLMLMINASEHTLSLQNQNDPHLQLHQVQPTDITFKLLLVGIWTLCWCRNLSLSLVHDHQSLTLSRIMVHLLHFSSTSNIQIQWPSTVSSQMGVAACQNQMFSVKVNWNQLKWLRLSMILRQWRQSQSSCVTHELTGLCLEMSRSGQSRERESNSGAKWVQEQNGFRCQITPDRD